MSDFWREYLKYLKGAAIIVILISSPAILLFLPPVIKAHFDLSLVSVVGLYMLLFVLLGPVFLALLDVLTKR